MHKGSIASNIVTSISGYFAEKPFPVARSHSNQATEASPREVRAILKCKGMKIVTFLGYAGAEYEDPAAMLGHADHILDGLDPWSAIINIGATAQGIGAVYEIAKRRGFTTTGIVSTQAREQGVALSRYVDCAFYVPDATWGGYLPGSTILSPTSEAMVTSSDWLIAIGGGTITRDELLAATSFGKRLMFIPADMDHRIAQAKTTSRTTDYRGAAHADFAPAMLSSNVTIA